TDGAASETEGVLHRAGPGLGRILLLEQRVLVVHLEDERHAPGEVARPGLDEAERRGVGVAAGLDRQLVVVARIVGGPVGRERARRAVLEPLVHGQDDEAPRAAEAAVVEDAGEVGQGAGVVAPVPGEDLADSVGGAHVRASLPVVMNDSYWATSSALPMTS